MDGLRIELVAAVGETTDCCVVWLPEHRVALVSNLFGPLFPHFPNVNTIRGDRYRFVEPRLATNRMVRELRPEMLVTGRHDPIVGADLIEASLERLHDAVTYVHDRTLDGINAGTDVWTLMRDIQLPPELRVGQGYGKVSWAVRTFWEEYVGWFKMQSTTELYPDPAPAAPAAPAALAELVEVAGVDATIERAQAALDRGDAAVAVRLGEAVEPVAPEDPRLRAVMAGAHQHLLDDGGDVSFWEDGWLRTQLERCAPHDTVLGGVAIPAHSRVLVLWAAANLPDPDAAPDGRPAGTDTDTDTDTDPRQQPHFAFGRGIHFCLGAPIARMEGRIGVERLLAATTSIRLDPEHPPVRRPSIFMRRHRSLHLEVEPS